MFFGNNAASTTDRCSFCWKCVGKTGLKQCSKCRYVRYCSKECQRRAWPLHKKACLRASAMGMDPTPETEEILTSLNKWLACWRGTLYEFGILAMDLANSEKDKLATHVVFIELECREPQPTERARYLKVCGGRVMTRDEYVDAMHFLQASEQNIEGWKQDSRGDHTLQLNLVCEGHHRTLWITFHTLTHYFEADKRVSAALARTWQDVLIKKTEYGQPGFDLNSRWPVPHIAELNALRDLHLS